MPQPTEIDPFNLPPEAIQADVEVLHQYDPEGDDRHQTVRWIVEAVLRRLSDMTEEERRQNETAPKV